MPIVTLDFETRSRCDLRTAGLHVYARDKSTEVLCLAYKVDSQPVKVVGKGQPTPQELKDLVSSGAHIHAHNAEFEFEIWNNVLTGVPKLDIRQMRCSMARAMTCALPASLGGVAAALGVDAQKDSEGAKIMRIMCATDRRTGQFVWTPEYQAKLESYCVQDVNAEHAVEARLPPLSDFEQRVWELTAISNSRGVLIDFESVQAACELMQIHGERLCGEIEALTEGNVSTGKQVQKMLAQAKTWGLSLEDLSKDTLTEALKGDLAPEVRKLLELRLEASKASVAKYEKMIKMRCADDRVRGNLKYHGAQTGRFSAAGLQIQNITRGSIKDIDTLIKALRTRDYEFFSMLYPSPSEAASSALRAMITTEHEFFSADYSSIEARVIAWLAGEEKHLEEYHKGADKYVAMARDIFRKRDISANERQLGKLTILGAGFGMGHVKFIESCAGYGVTITPEMSKLSIDTFRAQYPLVVALWKATELAAVKAVRFPGQVFKAGPFLAYKFSGTSLKCRLPSGRIIYYPFARVTSKETKFGPKEQLEYRSVFQGKMVWESVWGGILAQHATQATARDVMVEAMVALDKAGFDIAFSVHDELCIQSNQPERYDEFISIMKSVPTWATGMPIAVGAWRGKRYRK